MKRINILTLASLLVSMAAVWAQTSDLVPVVAKPVSQSVELPGEFQPFLSVAVHAKVRGYVEKVLVDRGSFVKQGQPLVELSAPEMKAQIAEAESKVQSAESERLQAEAQLAAAESTAERMAKAAETPGAVAGNEVVLAKKQVDALKALVRAKQQASQAAASAVSAQKDLESYLRIAAPFDGVVTERLVHPGALVGPGSDPVLLSIQQLARLRLVVAVPEQYTGAISNGARVDFKVPAFPERTFAGTVARSAHMLDSATRTMPVELDVANGDASLAPGMYPSVKWPVRRPKPSLFVPKTSVVTTTERTFVVRSNGGRAEWVDVKKGAADGDMVEVMGRLQAGDQVVRRATDEMRDGTPLPGRAAGK
ncbi:efflux RND transporter periplasmic adaptor subunit [Paludibaculum fermentans]|uniref:Efflux RND transporter periplasmic adaptor subunit n=1 Tax=Paludibaculum fermentans TaxID=1473598 RepID=A0A7S7SH15_PALFE|nr:efflux RND transporter periplasmic adaptor subunit [Paludibaculum fermentans]QOY85417.1 efflux RND transporter periplasmic adaptor subunit [Paludibaculum fermentans]